MTNLLIDAYHLAYRCCFSFPDLATTSGEATGIIFGFLRTIFSLKKRFEDAFICVVWDTYPQRKKSYFPEYKNSHRRREDQRTNVLEQTNKLKVILKALGIAQAEVVGEEADDVICSLIKGQFKDDSNVIYGSDTDFFQLVGNNVQQISPRIGNRKEKIYNREDVIEKVQIEPELYPILKAFRGDPSDDLPGVKGRIPTKVLLRLIERHKNDKDVIEGIYNDGFVGLTLNQRTYLKEFEEQARINFNLIKLRSDLEVNIDKSVEGYHRDRIIELFKKYEFESFLDEFEDWDFYFGGKRQYIESGSFQEVEF